jgi:hypothetical protein
MSASGGERRSFQLQATLCSKLPPTSPPAPAWCQCGSPGSPWSAAVGRGGRRGVGRSGCTLLQTDLNALSRVICQQKLSRCDGTKRSSERVENYQRDGLATYRDHGRVFFGVRGAPCLYVLQTFPFTPTESITILVEKRTLARCNRSCLPLHLHSKR